MATTLTDDLRAFDFESAIDVAVARSRDAILYPKVARALVRMRFVELVDNVNAMTNASEIEHTCAAMLANGGLDVMTALITKTASDWLFELAPSTRGLTISREATNTMRGVLRQIAARA